MVKSHWQQSPPNRHKAVRAVRSEFRYSGMLQRQMPLRSSKLDARPIDRRPAVDSDLDRPSARIAQAQEIGQTFALTIATFSAADANEKGRRARIESRLGREHADDAADRPVGSGLALIGEVATDQPIAESRRLEPLDLVTITDRDAGVEPTVGPPKQPRTSGQP
jgi:hypothetical protein